MYMDENPSPSLTDEYMRRARRGIELEAAELVTRLLPSCAAVCLRLLDQGCAQYGNVHRSIYADFGMPATAIDREYDGTWL